MDDVHYLVIGVVSKGSDGRYWLELDWASSLLGVATHDGRHRTDSGHIVQADFDDSNDDVTEAERVLERWLANQPPRYLLPDREPSS